MNHRRLRGRIPNNCTSIHTKTAEQKKKVEKEVKNIISNLLAVIPPCNYCVDMSIFCCKGHFMTPNNWRNLENCLIPATCFVFPLGTTENNNCD